MPMTYHTGWRKSNATKHVFIAIPSYGDVKAGCMSALNAAQHNLAAAGISGDVVILAGDCHVDDARNSLARSFLESEATHIMFIDADIQFSADSIAKMLYFEEDAIGGVYPYKNDYESYPVLLKTPGKPQFDSRGLVEVVGLPGGFMLVSRAAIERLYKKNAHKGAWPVKGDKPGRMPVVEIWHRSMEKGVTRRSGDYEFCRKLTQAGFKIWAAPFLRLGHIGEKIWEGSIQDFWLRSSGEYNRIAAEIVGRISATDSPDPKDFITLSKAFGNEPYSADHMLLSVLHGLAKGADAVLETGSGLSSAIFASTTKGKVVSLESEPIWGSKTDRLLEDCGFVNRVTYCPFTWHEIGRWYDAARFDGKYDLVFIDGPRRDEDGIRARICDIMPQALANASVVVVDDTDDPDGMALLERLNKNYKFMFDVFNGPRRQFAVGTRE